MCVESCHIISCVASCAVLCITREMYMARETNVHMHACVRMVASRSQHFACDICIHVRETSVHMLVFGVLRMRCNYRFVQEGSSGQERDLGL